MEVDPNCPSPLIKKKGPSGGVQWGGGFTASWRPSSDLFHPESSDAQVVIEDGRGTHDSLLDEVGSLADISGFLAAAAGVSPAF